MRQHSPDRANETKANNDGQRWTRPQPPLRDCPDAKPHQWQHQVEADFHHHRPHLRQARVNPAELERLSKRHRPQPALQTPTRWWRVICGMNEECRSDHNPVGRQNSLRATGEVLPQVRSIRRDVVRRTEPTPCEQKRTEHEEDGDANFESTVEAPPPIVGVISRPKRSMREQDAECADCADAS